MRILIIGASGGLGRALADGLAADGNEIIGVSRTRPADSPLEWITADFTDPSTATAAVTAALGTPARPLDTVIYNLGLWEPTAFTDAYRFSSEPDTTTETLIAANVTAPILLLRALLPALLASQQPRVILTGSTSGLPRSGRPEVAFGASKFALSGIADALREGHRDDRLAVTTLQLGNLNTEDSLSTPVAEAAARGAGTLVPVHDVVALVRTILALSPSSCVRELILPAILDERW